MMLRRIESLDEYGEALDRDPGPVADQSWLDRDQTGAAGFDTYLVKPGEIADLERLLGGDRVSDALQH
jgi:hypothetical protein